MINLKIGAIIIGAFAAGAFIMSPVPQAIAAVIATDVQCTGCVGTSDVAGNAITAAKIKDGEVKAAEIATDAVGAAEIQGVTKLLFGQCGTADESTFNVTPGNYLEVSCSIAGADTDDSAIATLSDNGICFGVTMANIVKAGEVKVMLRNDCSSTQHLGIASLAVIVFDK